MTLVLINEDYYQISNYLYHLNIALIW